MAETLYFHFFLSILEWFYRLEYKTNFRFTLLWEYKLGFGDYISLFPEWKWHFPFFFYKLKNNSHFLSSDFEFLVCWLLMLHHTQGTLDIILQPAFWVVIFWTKPSDRWNSFSCCIKPWRNLLSKLLPYSLSQIYWFSS